MENYSEGGRSIKLDRNLALGRPLLALRLLGERLADLKPLTISLAISHRLFRLPLHWCLLIGHH